MHQNHRSSMVVSNTKVLLLCCLNSNPFLATFSEFTSFTTTPYFVYFQDPHGELTGKNVLIIRGSVEETAERFGLSCTETRDVLERGRRALFEVRKQRPSPHLDDKMITSWNGWLTISSTNQIMATADCPALYCHLYLIISIFWNSGNFSITGITNAIKKLGLSVDILNWARECLFEIPPLF